MSKKTSETREHHYICGQCGEEVYAVITKQLPDKCPECGWKHKARKKDSVPSEFKIDLNKY